jgi:hypothetical protein
VSRFKTSVWIGKAGSALPTHGLPDGFTLQRPPRGLPAKPPTAIAMVAIPLRDAVRRIKIAEAILSRTAAARCFEGQAGSEGQ